MEDVLIVTTQSLGSPFYTNKVFGFHHVAFNEKIMNDGTIYRMSKSI
jgi:hypothetical protein